MPEGFENVILYANSTNEGSKVWYCMQIQTVKAQKCDTVSKFKLTRLKSVILYANSLCRFQLRMLPPING